jgi:hypothetical protein
MEHEDHSNVFFSVSGLYNLGIVRFSPQHFVFKYLQPLSFLQKQTGGSVHVKLWDRIININLL